MRRLKAMVTRHRVLYRAAVVVAFLLGAEIATRIDDWVRLGVPPTEHFYSKDNLIVHDALGRRGRPHGRYQKWQLNRFGFRGPEIELVPNPQRIRIMVLGASETFGLYESPRREFPAQLDELLRPTESYEVVNAAIAGMTVRSMALYWENWASRFQPRWVLIYPSPLFYLSSNAVVPPRTGAGEPKRRSAPQNRFAMASGSRFLARLRDAIEMPVFLQKWRAERWIALQEAGQGPDWHFVKAPLDRLDQFQADLTALIEAIRAGGAEPILLTHALRSSSPPRAEDLDDLNDMRVHLPRATAEAMVEFEDLANQRIRDFGPEHGVLVIDAAALLSGQRDWFADLVHFNDRGAARIAELIAGSIRRSTIPTAIRDSAHVGRSTTVASGR